MRFVCGWVFTIAFALWLPIAIGSPELEPTSQPSETSSSPQTQPADQSGAFEVRLSPTVTRLIDDPITSDEHRQRLRIFHGQWEKVTDPTPLEQAQLAMLRYELNHPALKSPDAPPLLRAEAAIHRGEPEQVETILADQTSPEAQLLKSIALELTGNVDDAKAKLLPVRQALEKAPPQTAPAITATGQAIIMLARLEGRPAQDYHRAMGLFSRAYGEVDRLYWPAMLAEAELLMEKHNSTQAAEAVFQAMSLNPNSSRAWMLLGELSVNSFQFDKAEHAANKLRKINKTHLLADLLDIRAALAQKDAAIARPVVQSAMTRYPNNRKLVALWCATEALSYDAIGFNRAMEKFNKLAPNNPMALAYVGRHFAISRQYDAGNKVLRQAIAAAPTWPEPRSELGLMLMQAGREDEALVELRAAAKLDPFNTRVANQLKLVEHLSKYETIETKHFIIKYQKGIDEVLARDMPEEMEEIYRDITNVFQHKPARKTLIELFPNERWFGVRITGVPDIWTIAASTGDVIGLTPPRSGVKQRGSFDWARVLRHEFVHTVTLDMTANRLPHWFTEACAVSQELGGRDYQTCNLLFSALKNDKLFDLQQINIAFVRPKTQLDRPLAYAQSAWMYEYIVRTYRHQAIIDLLKQFRQGRNIHQAIETVAGITSEKFTEDFKAWAKTQVREWGFVLENKNPRIHEFLRDAAGSENVDKQILQSLLKESPEHPDLLEVAARLAMRQADGQAAWEAVNRYAAARPVDPWPHQAMAQLATAMGRPERAIGALQHLDSNEQSDGRWAFQLTKLYQRKGDLNAAAAAAKRALQRQPYNGTYRELAATIALQRGDMDVALHHITGLSLLEPDHAIHQVRLAALYHRLGRADDANNAAQAALKLDADAPVQKFLSDE